MNPSGKLATISRLSVVLVAATSDGFQTLSVQFTGPELCTTLSSINEMAQQTTSYSLFVPIWVSSGI